MPLLLDSFHDIQNIRDIQLGDRYFANLGKDVLLQSQKDVVAIAGIETDSPRIMPLSGDVLKSIALSNGTGGLHLLSVGAGVNALSEQFLGFLAFLPGIL